MASFVVVGFLLLAMGSSEGYYFNVGGKDGWVPNPSENFNDWAARNRFQVNDSLVFRYEKEEDSVLLVSEADYHSCRRRHPIEKHKSGVSVIKLGRPGPFFFISGVSGRCCEGQKLIVVVMAPRHHSTIAPSPSPSATPEPSPKGGPARSPTKAPASSPPTVAVPPHSAASAPAPSPKAGSARSPTKAPASSPPTVAVPSHSAASAPAPFPNVVPARSPATAPASSPRAAAVPSSAASPGPSSSSSSAFANASFWTAAVVFCLGQVLSG